MLRTIQRSLAPAADRTTTAAGETPYCTLQAQNYSPPMRAQSMAKQLNDDMDVQQPAGHDDLHPEASCKMARGSQVLQQPAPALALAKDK